MIFQVLHPYIGLILTSILVGALWYRLVIYQYPRYRFSSTVFFKSLGQSHLPRQFFFVLRLATVILLVCASARIAIPDYNSKMPQDGIDIMLALDVSGSMFHRMAPGPTPFDVVKEHAIEFVNKRESDAIGLVFFAQEVLARTPLTHDHQFLVELLKETKAGVLAEDGTSFYHALWTAFHRLKKTPGKSKVIVALTDGMPSDQPIEPALLMELAQKYKVKIYIILIKSPYVQLDPLHLGYMKQFADKTQGKMFNTYKLSDLKQIYDEIDALEKTVYEIPRYRSYYELFPFFVGIAGILYATELLVATFLWRGI